MPTKLELLLEAERRGILPQSKAPLLAEARRRGLVPGGGQKAASAGQGAIMPDMPYDPRQQKPPGGAFSPQTTAAGARTVDDFVRSLASGASLGYADELAALGNRALGQGDYASNVAKERARDEAISPAVRIPGEIGGGVASAVASTPAAVGRLPGLARAVGLGGAYGAGYGSGTAEEGGRVGGAISGGLGGAATGGALHGLMRTLPGAVGGMRRFARDYTNPQGRAPELVGQAFRRDQIPLGRAQAQLRDLGPQGTLADVGDMNVRGLARGLAGQPGPAKQRILGTLKARGAGESERIIQDINRNLGPGDYFASEMQFLSKLSKGARESYSQAYQAHPNVGTPGLSRLMEAEPMRRALREAREIARNDKAAGGADWLSPVDDEIDALFQGNQPGQGISLEAWDYVKRGLDSLLEKPKYANQMTGRVNKLGRSIANLKRRLVSELDRATGGENSLYAAARQRYSGDAEMLGAIRDGKNFMKLAPEEIRAQLADLPPSAQEAYRNGAARALLDITEGVADNRSVADRLFNKSITRKKIEALFGNKQAYANFAQRLRAEQTFAETARDIGQGSRTAPMLEEIDDVKRKAATLGAILGSQSPFGHQLVMSRIGRQMAQKAIGQPEELNKVMAKILTTRNRAEQLRYLEQMAPQMREEALRQYPWMRALIIGATQAQE